MLLAAGAALGSAVVSRAPFAVAQPTPTPSPVSSPSAMPSGGPTPTVPPSTPAATPTTAPTFAPPARPAARSATPQPLPTPAYNFVYRATPAPNGTSVPGPNPPQIDEIDLSDATIVTPGVIRVRVLTNDAVSTVTADTFGRTVTIPQEHTGLFALEATLPEVPFFLKNRRYDIEFVAAVPDGRTARVTLPLTLR